MDTAVTTRDEAMGSSLPAILVDADGWTDSRVALPVSTDSHSVISVSDAEGTRQPATLTLDPALPFGSVQTTFVDNRTVVVASSNHAPAQLDSLLQWLDSDVKNWSRLAGNALISAPG